MRRPSIPLIVLIGIGSAFLSSGPVLSDDLFRRGDANSDGHVNISDAVKTLLVLFRGEPGTTCADAMDADDDGKLDISDPIAVLVHLFAGGPALSAPGSLCGRDPTADGLGCAEYGRCPPGDRGVQASGSIYRIDLPAPEDYNGRLVIWAHGFQDAGTPVEIPDGQMRFGDFYLPELIPGMGFAFATNSYSKTGLAVRQGVADIVDLVEIFIALHGEPEKIYIVGASEGGLITTLLVEGYPEIFAGGLAACGPVGDFEMQIGYFGDFRVLFDRFFPGLIPGDPFDPPPALVAGWEAHFETVVKPAILDPLNRESLEALAVTARLPVDPDGFLSTAEVCIRDALSYGVVNLDDAVAVLGGFPFDNLSTVYSGSPDDGALNREVLRKAADPAAVEEMRARYVPTGRLARPLVTIHTLLDSQVPYEHETIYGDRVAREGSAALLRHIPVDRFGHCEFTSAEVLGAFGALLEAAGDI